MDKVNQAVNRLYDYLITKPTHWEYESYGILEKLSKGGIELHKSNDEIELYYQNKKVRTSPAQEAILLDGFERCLKGKESADLEDLELMVDELFELAKLS